MKDKKKGITGKDIATAIGKGLQTMGYGDLLIRLKIHKLLPYLLYAFFLSMVSIFMSYKAEQTMLKMERNKSILETQRIYHGQKTCDMVSLDRISTIETMLEELGSNVKPPQKPADRLIR